MLITQPTKPSLFYHCNGLGKANSSLEPSQVDQQTGGLTLTVPISIRTPRLPAHDPHLFCISLASSFPSPLTPILGSLRTHTQQTKIEGKFILLPMMHNLLQVHNKKSHKVKGIKRFWTLSCTENLHSILHTSLEELLSSLPLQTFTYLLTVYLLIILEREGPSE